MGAERETRKGANVLYSGGDRLHSAQGEADFGNPNTPPELVSGAGCCHFTVTDAGLIRLQRIYNFLLLHAILSTALDIIGLYYSLLYYF